MRIWILISLIVGLISCQESQPDVFEGIADVYVTDTKIMDTLDICYCWQTQDSINLRITYGPFMGIAINVKGKNNLYATTLEYYSDTNEFNGEFHLAVPIKEDSLSVTYQSVGDSIRISGYIDIHSEVVEFYNDGREIKAFGKFNCMMYNKQKSLTPAK